MVGADKSTALQKASNWSPKALNRFSRSSKSKKPSAPAMFETLRNGTKTITKTQIRLGF